MFDRSGERVIVAGAQGTRVVEVESGAAVRIADTGALAAFDGELWIAGPRALARYDLAGAAIGRPLALPSPTASLAPAPCGPPAAIWTDAVPHAVSAESGALVMRELPGELVLPLTGRKHVIARGPRVALPTGAVVPLAATGAVQAGAITRDGKLAVMVLAGTDGRQLVVVPLASAQVAQRRALHGAAVRLADRRGIALAQVAPDVMIALDLRAGRELGTIELDPLVDDFAIDPEGRRIALRRGDELELIELEDGLQRSGADAPAPEVRPDAPEPTAPPPEPADAPPASDPPVIAAAVPAEPAASAPFTPAPLTAFAPRARPVAAPRERALAELDAELRGVMLWTLEAIAHAWDTRRIAYGNEGRHPYELEVSAIVGAEDGHARPYVAAARARVAEHAQARAADPGARASDTPLGALAAEFALGERALDVLLVVAAPALWGELARLYGILTNDAARPLVDELLVQQVLALRHDRHAIAAELDPRGTLVRLGLVHISPRRPRPFAELVVDPVILDRLRAESPALGPATEVRAAPRRLHELDLRREVITTALAELACGGDRIAVRGRLGSGRRTLLAALAALAGRDLAVIDARALPYDQLAAELALALRRAQLAGHVPAVANLEAGAEVERALAAHPGPVGVIAGLEVDVPLAPGHIEIALPPLDETERRVAWDRALAEAGLSGDAEALAARYRIGAGAIRQAIRAAGTRSGDATLALDAAIRQRRHGRLAKHARRVERLASWGDVVLPPDVLESLHEIVARVRFRRTVCEAWGMSRVMTTSRGLTTLFQGEPGTGKTLAAGVIARELGLELYQVDLAKVTSKWLGETEKHLGEIFDAAEEGQAILLFDEADSLFGKRTDVKSSNDRYANLEVNFLLQRLDAFEGIAILTTNAGGSIDEAFKRRLSYRLTFPFPDEDTRADLWRAHVPPSLPVAGALDFAALARTYQLSGGYIRNACVRAAFLAAQDGSALHQHHLERAVALELTEMGKLTAQGERR